MRCILFDTRCVKSSLFFFLIKAPSSCDIAVTHDDLWAGILEGVCSICFMQSIEYPLLFSFLRFPLGLKNNNQVIFQRFSSINFVLHTRYHLTLVGTIEMPHK